MATKTTTALDTPLGDHLDRLTNLESSDEPVVSLYLDLRPDHNGKRDHIRLYTRQVLEAYPDLAATIERHLADDVPKSARGLALFASAKGEILDSIPMDAIIEQHEFHVGPVPHLYPLARINDQYPRYVALLLNSDSARLFVFSLGAMARDERLQSDKTRRTSAGGWSQARYQRRTNNMHKAHIKDVVAMLDRIVADEHIESIVVACDDTTRPLLMDELPKPLAERIVDTMHLDVKGTPDHEVLKETLEALREQDAKTDAEEVQRMLDAWKARGLGAAGIEPTLKALEMRQVETLLMSANPSVITRKSGKDDEVPLIDQLVTKAQQNGARVRFIEDESLLSDVGGVGAILRFRI